MNYVIVGTAGHIDHGKTVLVEALTGIKTDRLKEEQERGISIELGFASFKMPDGTKVGVVDVPGHERFIRQMLAGVAGIDLVLLIIAADESVMPQTREHLDIIDLLQIKKGIIVITKTDLVDEEWLELVKEEVKETVTKTVLSDAAILAVSAKSGQGMDELKKMLYKEIAETPPKESTGRMRLPIDRFFSVMGFGTVVTGTLWNGELRVGDHVEIMPEGIISRVRNIQVHGDNVEAAVAGQRVAVNLANIETEQLHRGQVLAEPGLLNSSHRMDAQLKLLDSLSKPLKQRARIRLHLGTSEIFARVNLLDREELKPGDTCFCQLMLEESLVASRLDRFVIRTYSPMFTIGGGLIIDPVAAKHKRYKKEILDELATKLKGSPAELVMQLLLQKGTTADQKTIANEISLDSEQLRAELNQLEKDNLITCISYEGANYVISTKIVEKLSNKITQFLSKYHEEFPLRLGMPKEELRSRMFSDWEVKQYNALISLLNSEGLIKVSNNDLAKSDFEICLTHEMQTAVHEIEAALEKELFSPPSWQEIVKELSLKEAQAQEILSYMMLKGLVEKVNDELIFSKTAVQKAKELVTEFVTEHKSITLGEARDILGSSRKYVLPLLEHFDQTKFTKRIQDKRILY